MSEQPRVFRRQPHWTDELPDLMVVATPEDAVRLLDAAPEHANAIYTGPVKPGTALVLDVRKLFELHAPNFRAESDRTP